MRASVCMNLHMHVVHRLKCIVLYILVEYLHTSKDLVQSEMRKMFSRQRKADLITVLFSRPRRHSDTTQNDTSRQQGHLNL